MDRISQLEVEISTLRNMLKEKENELYELKKNCRINMSQSSTEYQTNVPHNVIGSSATTIGQQLPRWAIERYSRQILLSEIGVEGQIKICLAKVLVVGAGGLGCPVASYLAGAGVGQIGIVDYDTVDVTNIHRQLLHSETDQFMSKVESAANSLRRINSQITVTPYNIQLDSSNAISIISKYNIIIDCTDNVPTRYLLNDACVLCKVPLVSGSALKMEGQLTIYNYRNDGVNDKEQVFIGPCYRCLFESPPPPETVGSCSANGVCGPIPGAIGCLQALEVIKIIVGISFKSLLVGRMLLFDGEDMSFRIVKLRQKNPNCAVCSDKPTITQLVDYEVFCRSKAQEKDLDLRILSNKYRITPSKLATEIKENVPNGGHLLIDVRSEPEFKMCKIDGAVNYPIDSLDDKKFNILLNDIRKGASRVTFLCRRGNDSQIVAQRVIDNIEPEHINKVKDLNGGLHAWAKDVDNQFPIY